MAPLVMLVPLSVPKRPLTVKLSLTREVRQVPVSADKLKPLIPVPRSVDTSPFTNAHRTRLSIATQQATKWLPEINLPAAFPTTLPLDLG